MAAEASTLLGIEHYIYRTDGRVYVRRVGDGEPIIFLHSVSSHAKAWAYMVERLARRFTCYTIDMPGHDHSDIPPRKYTLEDYADSILDVIETIGLEKTDVVGDHTGSMIALILAAKHPKRVRKLVLDGLPYWNGEQGKIIWERWFTPMYTDTTSYHVPVIALETFEEAKANDPKPASPTSTPEIIKNGRFTWILAPRNPAKSVDQTPISGISPTMNPALLRDMPNTWL